MRSHLALIVVAALAVGGCARALQPSHTHTHACRPARAAGAPSGIGIIGMSLDQRTNDGGRTELIVDRVVPDGPAATAGIRPGDRIVRIGDTPTDGMSIADAARRLRGPIDASVGLVIATGSRPRDVRIMRVAPSELWKAAGTTAGAGERVRASDVAPATQVTTPPCRE